MERPIGPDAPARRRRVLVIGAGISGLAAARAWAERGHDPVILERGDEIGGVWAPSRRYAGVRTQSPKALYAFTDEPMPDDYPEWPSGEQVHAYLEGYARSRGLLDRIRLGRTVAAMNRAPGGAGWRVRHDGPGGEAVEDFDFVTVASGTYSAPNRLTHEGQGDFEAAGGQVLHSSELREAEAARGRDVVVIGFSKSATDVAVEAARAGARSVIVVHRRPVWRIPYRLGGVLNFKHVLYCRASEAMFPAWGATRAGRLARRGAQPLVWLNWRAMEALLDRQMKLSRTGLRPSARIEDGVSCGLSLATEGFHEMVGEGRIRCVRGAVACYEGRGVVVGEARLAADLVVQATGWTPGAPFLPEWAREALVEPDGQWRLHRLVVNPDVPDLGFVGFNSSFCTTISSELAAQWLVRFADRRLRRQPDEVAMRRGIEEALRWRRTVRPAALAQGGNCAAPFHFRHFDELLGDIGARSRRANPLAEWVLPPDATAYGRFLASAPDYAVA